MSEIQEDGMTVSALPANHTGPGIVNVDPIMTLKAPLKRRAAPWDTQLKTNFTKYNNVVPQPKKLRDIIGRDTKNERRADKR